MFAIAQKFFSILLPAILFISAPAFPQTSDTISSHHCTVGYAMGNAVDSGRAVIWRNYDWLNHTENSSLEYEGTNSYLSAWGPLKWIGTSQESWYIFGGLNEKGLGCFNTLMVDFANLGGYSYGNYRIQAWILANCSTLAQVRSAVKEQIDFNNNLPAGVDHEWNYNPGNYSPAMSLVVIDASGKTTLFEIAQKLYFEYDHDQSARMTQYPVQVGSRANKPHRNTDHTDNPGTLFDSTGGRRFYDARDHLTKMASNTDKLTLQEVMDSVSRWGSPSYDGIYDDPSNAGCRNSNYATMDGTVIWGAAPGEDPRTATLFYAGGIPDYSAFVPVWAMNGNSLSSRLTSKTAGISAEATKLYSKRVDSTYDDYANSFFRGMETNFREAVAMVRTHWNANGFDAAMADRISDEAAEVVYQTMVTMNKKSGFSLNSTPELMSITPSINGFVVSFTRTASDNGSITSTSWDFGDGTASTLTAPQHTYTSAGTYLVRCRVTDNEGSMNSRWMLVTVPGVVTGDIENQSEKITLLMNRQVNGVFIFADEHFLNDERYRLSVYDKMGRIIGVYDIHSGNTEIDLSTQPDGLYLVQAFSEKKGIVFFGKVIVTR